MPRFMIPEEYQSEIAKIPIFSYLAEREFKRLIKKVDLIVYQDGEKIISQDDLSEYFYG